MNVASFLGPEILDVAQALGLVDGSGNLSPSWFEDPVGHLSQALTNATQRQALLALLDQIVPSQTVPGAPSGEKWHPLLGTQATGNVYLTVNDSPSGQTGAIAIGIGAQYQALASPGVSILLELPVAFVSGSSFSLIAFTQTGELSLSVAVDLNWTQPANPIGLSTLSAALLFAPLAANPVADFEVTLEGLDLDGKGSHDVTLGPGDFGSEAANLLIGLIHAELQQILATASGEAQVVAANLPALLGLTGDLPLFPFTTLATDPKALVGWLRSLTTGTPAPLTGWLGNLAALLGAPIPAGHSIPTVTTTVSGSTTTWSVPVIALDSNSSLLLTLALAPTADKVTPQLSVGLGVNLVPGASGPVSVAAEMTVLTMPLAGSLQPAAFPNGNITVRAPADSTAKLVPPGGVFSADSLEAGFSWNGSTLQPLLELTNVKLNGSGPYAVIDLTDANNVVAAASNAVASTLNQALGSAGAGTHLAALVGLVEPLADSSAPLVDFGQLVSHPTAAIATLHRSALLSSTHPWTNYFQELVHLLDLPGPVAGSGTTASPWSAAIATAGPLSLNLVAWNAQTSGNSADPQMLRIGLSVAAATAASSSFTASTSCTIEILSADLVAQGSNTVRILGGYHASASITPGSLPEVAGITAQIQTITAGFDLIPGSAPAVQLALDGVSVTTPAGTVQVPSLSFPMPAGFDLSSPAALGISAAQLEQVVLALLAGELSSALGPSGLSFAALLGAAPGATGLQTDFPALAGAAGSLFTDPVSAWRSWLGSVAAGLSSDGTAFIGGIVPWIAGLVSANPPSDLSSPPDASIFSGSGTYADPWSIPIGGGSSAASALLWLEPDGPLSEAATVAGAITAVPDLPSLVTLIAQYPRYLGALPDGLSPATLASGLESLSSYLASGDGVVPLSSQQPAAAGWSTGTAITAAHPDQPLDSSACTQILAQVDAWAAPGTNRAILLLGPGFSDHAIWNTLLAQQESAHPGSTNAAATFNLRVPGVDPASIDLRGITVVADYYTADLYDDGSGNLASLTSQIGPVIARILALKPGAAIILAAHSTAGVAARAYAQANSTQLKGIITLGTPHLGAALTPLTDSATAEAVRFLINLLPSGVAAGPLHDALQHLRSALDSYLPAASAGQLPQAWPYPIGSFAGAAGTDTGGVPVLALGGQLTEDLLGALTTAIAAQLAAFTAQAPTAIGYGARVALNLGPDSGVHSEMTVRLDTGRFAWNSATPPPPRPAQALTVTCTLLEEGGWLAGGPLSWNGPGTALTDIRVRSARFGAVVAQTGSTLTATPFATLTDAAFHSPASASVPWGNAQLSSLFGSVFAQIASPAPARGTSLATLLSALEALGVVAVDFSGALAISADAITALQADALTFLAGKVQSTLSSAQIPGFTASGSAWTYTIPGLPLQAVISTSPASFGIETVSSAGGLAVAGSVALNFSAALALANLQPTLSASLTLGSATLTFSNGSLSLAVPPALPALQLYPLPVTGTILSALNASVPLLLLDSLGSAALSAVAGPGYTVSGLLTFLQNPGAWIVGTSALGDGTVLDPAKLNQLFAKFGMLPSGITLTASGKDPTTISLANSTPIGGLLTIALGVAIDRTRHLAPSGTVTIQTNLKGGTWPNVGVTFGVSSTGITLAVTPGGGAQPIQLLPTFSGSATFAAAAEALLPAALDGLIRELAPNPASPPALVKLALEVAAALDIYDSAGGFAAHTAQLTAMLDGSWFTSLGSTVRNAFLTSAATYFNDASSPLHSLLPGTISTSGTTLKWTFPIPGGIGSGNLSLEIGWDNSGPAIQFAASAVQLSAAPLSIDTTLGFASGSFTVGIGLGISLEDALGISVVPELNFGVTGSTVSMTLLPLGTGTASTLSLRLLPSPSFTFSQSAPGQIIAGWGIPLVAELLINAIGTEFTQPLWNGGPTIATTLEKAQIVDNPSAQHYKLHTPLASVPTLLGNIAAALSPVTITLSTNPQLSLVFSDSGGTLGVGILGSLPLSAGSPSVSLLFGAPATWLGSTAGIILNLFTTSGGVNFAPALHVRGLGIGLSGAGDAPLLNESGFSIGAVDAYLAFDLDLKTGHLSDLGGGLEIDKLGLPLNLLNSASSSNPVASSLLSSNGGSAGDSTPPNPAVDVIAYYLDGSFTIQFAGTNQPIVIPVHAGFGPVYIDQIDLALAGTNSVTLGVDGSLQINGLTVGVIDLALQVPLPSLLDPSTWSLDLEGLAVSLSADPVEISGGLSKNPGPPIQYDGMLSVTVENIGFSIVAAYSRPSDAQGAYTSLFMFVALDFPLGGPPFAFVIGLGGGFGYNRQLNVPADINNIDSFLLVSAIDDDSLANDPMSALMSIGSSIPPARGAYWLAAGVRFTSFALVNSTVIVVIALDRGFEIDVLGISRMALPTEQFALASVELALKARYNSEEGVLSVQAQLTDNSYLFDRDCQLTGGFAFFAWFPQGQFVLTLGGYNPVFSKPAQFPDVPRLGFNWSVSSNIVVKGGAYFALTNTCVMAGGSLSATASFGPISAWFNCYVDFLVAWDPFAYEFDIGVEIGASLNIRVCFFACATIHISISVGAQLMIAGPPFHGTASIDAEVTTITVSFGSTPQSPNYITDFGYFSQKYLTAGDPNGNAVLLQFSKGLLAPNPPGAQPVPGTQSQPWQVGIEFAFQTSTRMPANQTQDFLVNTSPAPTPGVNSLDLAPMDEIGVTSTHSILLQQQQSDGSWQPPALIDPSDHFTLSVQTGYFPEATWHWFDPKNVPAGARTITAVNGISIDGHVVFNTQSALIPISTLVADLPEYALPLPFATTAAAAPTLQGYGAAADSLLNSIRDSSSSVMLAAGSEILSGNNAFSQNRTAFGLPASGIPPLATAALRYRRSAPPAVMPITTGLTMKPVGLKAPILAETVAPVASIVLEQPRLRNVLQRVPLPVSDVPVALHTTVTRSAARAATAVPRFVPPAATALTGARLIRVPAASAPRPTSASIAPRASTNAAAGLRIAPLHQQALDAAASSLLGNGVVLAGSAAHVWELAQSAGVFSVTGQGAFRAAFSDRSGAVLSDQEYGSAAQIPVPPGAALAIFESLGNLPADVTPPPPAFGAISAAFAPPTQPLAVGWQESNTLFQLGPTRLLARGASLRLPRATASQQLRQKASSGTILASTALQGQAAVETQLAASISTVILLLDLADANAAASGDLTIAVDGATLTTPPTRVATANRRMLFYDVASIDQGAASIVISVVSETAWKVAGVIGVHGRAADWAAQLGNGIPPQFVPNGPLTPDGSLTVTYSSPSPAAKGAAA